MKQNEDQLSSKDNINKLAEDDARGWLMLKIAMMRQIKFYLATPC